MRARPRSARHRQACQSLGGGRLDKAIVAAFLEAATIAGIAATAGAIRELHDQHEQRLAGQRLAVERAQFEAERARRQYDGCEAEHRLVARTLERALEEALVAVERERGKLAALEQARPAPLTDEERQSLGRLERDLPRLWDAEATSDRDRKQLLRTLISEVVVSEARACLWGPAPYRGPLGERRLRELALGERDRRDTRCS